MIELVQLDLNIKMKENSLYISVFVHEQLFSKGIIMIKRLFNQILYVIYKINIARLMVYISGFYLS